METFTLFHHSQRNALLSTIRVGAGFEECKKMRQYKIELDAAIGKFINIPKYFCVQKERGKGIQVTVYSKSYDLLAKSVHLVVSDYSETKQFYETEFTINHCEYSFILEQALVYRVRAFHSPWNESFILHIQNCPSNGYFTCRFEELAMISVVPKWLGPIKRWSEYFDKFSKTKFNAIHLLPFQSSGSSNSPYSIRDHFQIDRRIQPNLEFPVLQDTIRKAKKKNALLFVTDVVWNHVSGDSEWLKEHPECGYNLLNSPHLKIAYQLDQILLSISAELSPFNVTVENLEFLSRLIRSKFDKIISNYWSNEKLLDDFNTAITNIIATVYYERIDENGPKKGPITKEFPIVSPYFTVVANEDRFIFANNGWTFNSNETNSFVEPQSKAYLRRELVIWCDCVKLCYGKEFSDNSWLWNYMAEYTKELAKCFDGFRIDNCHSSPLNACKYFLQQARLVNPNLFIIGELFAGSEDRDIEFVSELGIDLLIREMMRSNSPSEYVHNSYRYSYAKPIGSLKYTKHSLPRTILMDCTHDNETPKECHRLGNVICDMTLTAFHNCSIGTTMGYDHLNEKRYDLSVNNFSYPQYQNAPLFKLRKFINNLHLMLAKDNYNGFYAESINNTVVKITRENPKSHCIYEIYANCSTLGNNARPYKLKIERDDYTMKCILFTHLSHNNCLIMEHDKEFRFLLPGHVCILFGVPHFTLQKQYCIDISGCNLTDLNLLLFQHSNEANNSSYEIPNYGKLFYCGLQSVFDAIQEAFRFNNLDHPICQNIRQGDWLIDYLIAKLHEYNFRGIVKELKTIKKLPHYYKPLQLFRLVKEVYFAACCLSYSIMNVKNATLFEKRLALTSVQLLGTFEGSGLSWNPTDRVACLAAGLPHFCRGHWRCWARDTFSSIRGLFLHTGRFEDAKNHILAFASCYKTGLIPNILDSARFPRFNARDSPWWFIFGIQEYCEFIKDYSILNQCINLRFNQNSGLYSAYDDPNETYNHSMTLIEIIYNIIQHHWNGINIEEDFPISDSIMHPKGRNIKIFTNRQNGFIYGGNEFNCGTWMDKMGHDGMPVTSRHGANIEIIALLYSSLTWLSNLAKNKIIDSSYTKFGYEISTVEWAELIKENFEASFYNYFEHYYFDTLNSHYELRPNFLIAMSIVRIFRFYF